MTRAAKTKVRARCWRLKKWDAFAEKSSHADGHQSDRKACKKAREAGHRAARRAAA